MSGHFLALKKSVYNRFALQVQKTITCFGIIYLEIEKQVKMAETCPFRFRDEFETSAVL